MVKEEFLNCGNLCINHGVLDVGRRIRGVAMSLKGSTYCSNFLGLNKWFWYLPLFWAFCKQNTCVICTTIEGWVRMLHSQLFEGFKCQSQIKNNGRVRSRGTFLGSEHFGGVEGCAGAPGGTRKNWKASLTHTGLHKTNTRWLVRSWNTFGARMNHGQLGHTRLTTARTWGKPPPSPL